MKFWGNTFLMIASMCLIMWGLFGQHQPPKPAFQVGQCIAKKPDPDREAWEKNTPYILKIDELGKAGYRTDQWLVDSQRWIESSSSFPFATEDTHQVVNCPLKEVTKK